MARTLPKTVRLNTDEMRQIQLLMEQFWPEATSFGQMARLAMLYGVMVLATQAQRPGESQYAGFAPDDLAARLAPRLQAAIGMLARHGYLDLHQPALAFNEPEPDAPLTNAQARDDLSLLGTDFLEDDDD